MILTYQKFKLNVEVVSEIKLPYYKGSTFRGGFGSMFKRIVCALRKKECGECMLRSKCVYTYIFETSPNQEANMMNMDKYEKIPHPFVIEPPEEDLRSKIKDSRIYETGEKIDFSLILIGKATDYLPYFIYTFEELGKIGIGKGRGRYRLTEVKKISNKRERRQVEDKTVFLSSDRSIREVSIDRINIQENFVPSYSLESIVMNFITPVRIKYRRDLVVKPEFHVIMRSLLRRIALLYYFHCGNKKPIWNHKEIINHAEKVSIKDSDIMWVDWERYSSRQGDKMKLGGIVGRVEYYGDVNPFFQILKAGEILHIGKGTSFGLGKYEII
jgi:hypothetical protein